MTADDADRFVYLLGRHGCLMFVKVGSTRDLPHRRSTVAEDRTATPPAARGRRPVLLAAWQEADGPTEAEVLTTLDAARWHTPKGHPSEYVATADPDVAALLHDRCPFWRDLVRHEPGGLDPIWVDRTVPS